MDIPNVITFHEVDFSYPAEDNREAEPICSKVNLDVPGGIVGLVGENGIGKSTVMLLAAARLFPESGNVLILGHDTKEFIDAGIDSAVEQRRNALVSFVYQNMEFETEEPIGTLFEYVYGAGNADSGRVDSPAEVVSALQLQSKLSMRMQELSKGEQQRAVIAMSVLYGSPVLMLDEPVFAVEPSRAEAVFEYLADISRRHGIHQYFSAHDIEFTRRYAQSVLLFHHDRTIQAGPAEELLQRPVLESAFRAPYDTLHRREALYREVLLRRYTER